MKNISILGVLVVVALGLTAFVAQAQLFSGRPDRLSTNVDFSSLHPVAFQIVVNGQQLATRRSSSLGDTGGTPYSGAFDRALEIDLQWIEIFSRQGYAASISVPVKLLSRLDAKGGHASVDIELGQGGAVTIATPHPDLNKHLREGTEDQITPEMDKPQIVMRACGTRLPEGDARLNDMLTWIDGAALDRAAKYRNAALKTDPNGKAPDPCGGGS